MSAFDPSWLLHKFGGTSVGSAESINQVIDILRPLCDGPNRLAVVVSAMGGKPKVTDLLLESVHASAANDTVLRDTKLDAIRQKHSTCVSKLFQSNPIIGEKILQSIEHDLKEIVTLLKAVAMMRYAHEQILELVSGYGEIWSATMITQALIEQGLNFTFINARDVLIVTDDEMGTSVCWKESEAKLGQFLEDLKSNDADYLPSSNDKLPHLLITGYVASTKDGVATTLKRDGSDFSASIFGKMLKASSVTIWTDVSGVYSADPRLVPDAQIISEISYNEAIELAYFGAKVIHPKTMAPAILSSIPIYIRNTFKPNDLGTRIGVSLQNGMKAVRNNSVCGFSSVNDIALLNMEGTGMAGVPGIAHRLFGALKKDNISVLMIAQASSEHSICFAIRGGDCDLACRVIKEAFFYEFNQEIVSNLSIIRNCSILAAIGESMSNVPGVSGLFFGALGNADINILSISQGCDERNISAVVSSNDIMKALRAVHSAFWLSSLAINVGVIGTGRIGSAVIQSLLEQAEILEKRFQITIKIRGVINSRKMLLGEDLSHQLKDKLSIVSNEPDNIPHYSSSSSMNTSNGKLTRNNNDGIEHEHEHDSAAADNDGDQNHEGTNTLKLFKSASNENLRGLSRNYSNTSLHEMEATMSEEDYGQRKSDFDTFFGHISDGSTPHFIIIDCSTSKDIAKKHPFMLTHGAHVVTANKRAICSSIDLYNKVYDAVKLKRRIYMSEVTIGASIPIKTTLNDVLLSGDAISSIVGVMSVSVNTVLSNMCDNGLSFSQSVLETYQKGLFESDAFEDLDGIEASQKLLVLARELGIPLNIEDVEVDSLAKHREVSNWLNIVEDGSFKEEDQKMKEKVERAAKNNSTLRFIQRINISPAIEIGNQSSHVNCVASSKLEEVDKKSSYAQISGPIYHFSFYTARYSQSPLIIQGPLSDSMNTASGIIGDVLRVARSVGARDIGPGSLSPL